VPAGPHRIDALSLFSLFSLRQNISQRHLVFPQKPWATDDYRCARTAWKLAVPSLFFAVLDSAKTAKSGYLSEQVQHVVSMKDPRI
jgi:hypothetical protein